MIKYFLMSLAALALIVAGCTPTTNTTNLNQDDSAMEDGIDDQEVKDDNTVKEDEAEVMDGEEVSEVSFNTYKNPAVGYSVDIPTNWYWRHYHKAEIVASNPSVDDYLLISPTHDITGFQTESPAEIIVEVSTRDLDEFADSSLSQSSASVAGQNATKLSGTVNNEVFSGYQKTEYQFVREGKTFRILYLASLGLDNNEAVFEQIVKSFSFDN